MRLLLALLVGLVATPALAQLHPTARGVITAAVEEAIRPGFAAFADTTGALRTKMGALCEAPSAEGLAAAQEAFKDVVLAWSKIELYGFEPSMKDNRTERILFYPDRKGIGLKQIQAILAKQDTTATDPATLQKKSVAVQGLGALEFVLFGTGSEAVGSKDGAFRCSYGNAIAALLGDTAAAMSAEWNDPNGISARLIHPSEDDPDFRTNEEVMQQLVGVMAHGVEAIRDMRILPFLGREGEESKPRSALFWRSNMTVPSIEANFAGLEALLINSDMWEYPATEQFWIGQDAKTEFGKVEAGAAKVTGTVEQAVADPGQKQAITDFVASSMVLGKLTGEDLPAALGLSVGFSALDGD